MRSLRYTAIPKPKASRKPRSKSTRAGDLKSLPWPPGNPFKDDEPSANACQWCGGEPDIGHLYYCRTTGGMSQEQAQAYVEQRWEIEASKYVTPELIAELERNKEWKDASRVTLLPPNLWECGGDPDCPICSGIDALYDVPPNRLERTDDFIAQAVVLTLLLLAAWSDRRVDMWALISRAAVLDGYYLPARKEHAV